MSDETRIIFPLSIQYQANKWQEQRKISIWGSLVDPIPNSPNLYYKNCKVDGKGIKENYKWDLGSERVNQSFKIQSLTKLKLFVII